MMVMVTVVVMVTAVMMLVVEFEMSYWGMVEVKVWEVTRWEKGVNFPVEMIGVDLMVLLAVKTGEGFLIVVVVVRDELEKMVVATVLLLVVMAEESFLEERVIAVVVRDELEKMVVAIGAMEEGVLAGLE
jgi:hypothetical protein